MKKQITLLTVLALTNVAFATSDLSDDRVEIAPGVVGIKHTENFEIVCDTKSKKEDITQKLFLDTDFSSSAPYRLAAGFPGGGTVMGLVAAEAKVVESAKGRCPGLCLSLTIESNEGAKSSVVFQEDLLSGRVSVTAIDLSTNKVTDEGECRANEVE